MEVFALAIAVFSATLDIAVDEEHDLYYVLYTGGANGMVVPMNAVSGTAGEKITVGAAPVAMAMNRVTRQIYVADTAASAITVIDGWTNLVIATIPVDSAPADVEVNEKTNRIYASCGTAGTLAVIDGNSNTVVDVVNIGLTEPKGIGVDETRNMIYVANNISGTVSIIDGATQVRLKDVPVGYDPWDVVVHPGLNKIFVTRKTPGVVTVLDGF